MSHCKERDHGLCLQGWQWHHINKGWIWDDCACMYYVSSYSVFLASPTKVGSLKCSMGNSVVLMSLLETKLLQCTVGILSYFSSPTWPLLSLLLLWGSVCTCPTETAVKTQGPSAMNWGFFWGHPSSCRSVTCCSSDNAISVAGGSHWRLKIIEHWTCLTSLVGEKETNGGIKWRRNLCGWGITLETRLNFWTLDMSCKPCRKKRNK